MSGGVGTAGSPTAQTERNRAYLTALRLQAYSRPGMDPTMLGSMVLGPDTYTTLGQLGEGETKDYLRDMARSSQLTPAHRQTLENAVRFYEQEAKRQR